MTDPFDLEQILLHLQLNPKVKLPPKPSLAKEQLLDCLQDLEQVDGFSKLASAPQSYRDKNNNLSESGFPPSNTDLTLSTIRRAINEGHVQTFEDL